MRRAAIETQFACEKDYAAFFFLRRRFFLAVFAFAFFAFFALRFLARFAIVCLLADLGLRFRVPEVFFDAFLRLETGFLAGRGFEGDISFGSIPKMPIMGLVESLLGIASESNNRQ